MNIEELSEELYNLLGEMLNSKQSTEIVNSLRGEYGVLRYLVQVKNNAGATEIRQALGVVPGRMADILNSLEKKGLIIRERDERDRRIVRVKITGEGIATVAAKRDEIRAEYRGLYDFLGKNDTEELIRLLKKVISFRQQEEK
ncbi:MAG: winged helix-turn-helix transcriptional regulator [Clostridia bacterium]|nr:winged helix-turn-helix transcriptional regulator [Clostridia bacterium]MBQ2670435.1 winged helix-turn-helix transcriptional regulator [Clostridia bacterium]MBQ3462355.1 winged helix-turn-helix transcriptional regulator [Clostridia bacterium]MBQ6531032.1 winged helix-turn-helix transcriptional regulator [Clostridia bacterium]MBQ6558184.1 winged helix-turn-helix transcriptional regulator [Clostridia bacterium]